jgi:hypothetical protein
MRRLIALPAALALCAFLLPAGGPVTQPPSVPAWQQSAQTFYPSVPALGSNDHANVYNATRQVMVNGPCALSAIKVVYTNSAINGGAYGEATSANLSSSAVALGTGTYDAMLEYPLGTTPVQITFGANNTVSIAAAVARTESDSYTVAIPANALYAIQSLSTNGNTSNSIGGYASKGVNNPLPHYAAANSTSSVVTTTSNTAPAQFGTGGNWSGTTTGAVAVGPLEVLGYVASSGCSQKSMLAKGDSHAVGQVDGGTADPGDANGFVGFIMRMLDDFPNVPPFVCACIGSNQIASYSAPSPSGVNTVENQIMQDVTNVIAYDFPNDIKSGATAAQAENYISRFADDAYAVGVKAAFWFRSPPQTSSSDTWKTYANQTQNSGFGAGGAAQTVNAWLNTGKTSGGNGVTMLDHVSGANGIGNDCTPGQGLSGANNSDNGLDWCADGSHSDGSTYGGDHPTSSGGITATTSGGIAFGNSYAVGAAAAYAILNPGSTAYGLLQ